MAKSYQKSHQSDTAYKSHKAKIRERGGVLDTDEFTGWGHKLKYHFGKNRKGK
jgi:hypothetical protein